MTENLIAAVRQYEVIYNPKCKEYKDFAIRTAVWEEIAQILSEPVDTCRENWAKLRNAYSSALKRRRNKKTGQPDTNVMPWRYEKQMSFLRPHIISRSKKNNLKNVSNTAVASLKKIEMKSDIDMNISSGVTAPLETYMSDNSPASPFSINESQGSSDARLPSPLSSEDESQRSLPLRRQRKSELQKIYELMTSPNGWKQQRRCNGQDLDETDLFFMSMSKAVKSLPKLDQAKIKLDLHTAVAEAEIKNIKRTDTTPNLSTSGAMKTKKASVDPLSLASTTIRK